MNNNSISTSIQPIGNQTVQANVDNMNIPPVVKRGAEVVGSLTVGALSGYIFYWITRLGARLGMIDKEAVIRPLPYVLSGIMSAGLVETVRLIYDLALSILGERKEYENLVNSEKASAFDRLRQKTWKVVTHVEKIQQEIDVIYSRLFDIRTEEEIRNKYPTDRQYYLSHPTFTEVIRSVFKEQIKETMTAAVPQELGVYAVEAMGFTIIGGHLFIWLHGVVFLNGLINKIGKVYEKIQAVEEEEEIKKRKLAAENKTASERVGAPNELKVNTKEEVDLLENDFVLCETGGSTKG